MNELALFGLLALAVSQVGWIIADSDLFEPVRERIRKLLYRLTYVNTVLDYVAWRVGEAIDCSSCVGMWAAFLAAGILRPDFLPGGVWVSVPTYAFGLALVARAIHTGIELVKRVAVVEEDE